MALVQRQYTLIHAFCSTVTVWDEEEQEMICMRSLDWQGSEEIAKSTRIFDLVNSDNKKVAEVAGVVGVVGVLTGVKEGFSIAINYAPWKFSARLHADPTFLIRELLQDELIDTYEKAVRRVKSWKVGAPCFITICGVKKGNAIVIECGVGGKWSRKAKENGLLVQTNHYDSKSDFVEYNVDFIDEELSEDDWYKSDLLANSDKRRKQIENMLKQVSQTSEALKEQLKEIFSKPPVMNHETAQWVLMRSSNGTMEVTACHTQPINSI